jgi:hypothetical protein
MYEIAECGAGHGFSLKIRTYDDNAVCTVTTWVAGRTVQSVSGTATATTVGTSVASCSTDSCGQPTATATATTTDGCPRGYGRSRASRGARGTAKCATSNASGCDEGG